MERLTYKSRLGDYGINRNFENIAVELCELRNALGKYEDLGYAPEDLEKIIAERNQLKNKTK